MQQETMELNEIIAESIHAANHCTPARYASVAFLDALEHTTGSKDEAIKALMAAHERHLSKAPEQARKALDAGFKAFMGGLLLGDDETEGQ